MLRRHYDWKRFWAPRGAAIAFDDDGYPYDPDSHFGSVYNPQLRTLEAVLDTPCLVLLGEPGIGKTLTLLQEQGRITAQIEGTGGRVLWFNLGEYGDETRLLQEVFRNSAVDAWKAGSCSLHIFLDSLDECLLRIDQVAVLLVEELKRRYPVDRLFLRIACRTAEWPVILEKGLNETFGEPNFGVYELAPLRRVDVREAAATDGLDADAFLRAVDERGVVPLAFKPVTLRLLLNQYRAKGNLPPTQTELYAHGCRLLCEELSDSRRGARRVGRFGADQRLAIASRIAAAVTFANRAAIWTGPDHGDVPATDVLSGTFVGGTELASGAPFEVSADTIRETLATGLFSARAAQRLGWAHKTYAEFLVARYVVEHGMSVEQIAGLILHPGDPAHKVVPQLRGTAAWIAVMSDHIFRHLREIDPEVLLRSDVVPTQERPTLVSIVLRLIRFAELSEWDARPAYRNLAHDGLPSQLRPHIRDSAEAMDVRRAAIGIAEICHVRPLFDDLVTIALNTKEPEPVRVAAVFAISQVGDDERRAKLRPLARRRIRGDHDDEIKGCALRALWPRHISTKEVLAVLTEPKNPRLTGTYQIFLWEFAHGLADADLPIALRWARKHAVRHSVSHAFARTVDGIMAKAWRQLDAPEVLAGFAAVALERLRHHLQIVDDFESRQFRNELAQDDARRRSVLDAMLPLVPKPEEDGFSMVLSPTPVATRRDFLPLITKLRTTRSTKQQLLIVELLTAVFEWNNREHADAVYEVASKVPLLADKFAWFLNPVVLTSPEAIKMREAHQQEKALEDRRARLSQSGPRPLEEIDAALRACESGEVGAWLAINWWMAVDPRNQGFVNEGESDLTALETWQALDGPTRARVVLAAERYVREFEVTDKTWVGMASYPRAEMAGYRALRLLLHEGRDVAGFCRAVWSKWAAITLAYPTAGDTGLDEKLVAIAYGMAPGEILSAVPRLVAKENQGGGLVLVTRKLDGCWDDRVAGVVLDAARREDLRPECLRVLLDQLLQRHSGDGRAFTVSLLTLPVPMTGAARVNALTAAQILMLHADAGTWPIVWAAIRADPQFGREVVSGVAQSHSARDEGDVLAELSDEQIADLYIWLVGQFPYSAGVHPVGPGQNGARLRDSLLNYLKARGTYRACDALRRIADTFPEFPWLQRVLAEAGAVARSATWVPPTPEQVLRLAGDGSSRLVQSGDELLNVLIESLRRFQDELHGETPAVTTHWDQVERGVWRPKDEHELADAVKRHLDRDLKQRGVIVNREVEIRRSTGGVPGEQTDVYVDAVRRDRRTGVHDRISAIVEVKGCWHPQLREAMETQLVNRYLRDNQCQYGLYLVGWFFCQQWDRRDSRKAQVPELTLNEAQAYFDAQAAELSRGHLHVKAVVINTALR